jgi:hypothetical protein
MKEAKAENEVNILKSDGNIKDINIFDMINNNSLSFQKENLSFP